jgi:hypothetical protein
VAPSRCPSRTGSTTPRKAVDATRKRGRATRSEKSEPKPGHKTGLRVAVVGLRVAIKVGGRPVNLISDGVGRAASWCRDWIVWIWGGSSNGSRTLHNIQIVLVFSGFMFFAGALGLAQCTGSLGDKSAPQRELFVTRLVAGHDVSSAVAQHCSSPNYLELLAQWNTDVKVVRRNKDWSRFQLLKVGSSQPEQTMMLIVGSAGACIRHSAFGQALPESYPGEKCSRCTIEVWRRP